MGRCHESTGIDGDLGHLFGNLGHVQSSRSAPVARERLEAGRRQEDRLPRWDVWAAGVVCWERRVKRWPRQTCITRFIGSQVRPVWVAAAISELRDAGPAPDMRR